MCGHADGLFRGTDIRRTYIRRFGGAWQPVQYANVDGLAIFEGCIILGRTDEMEANLPDADEAVKAMPDLLKVPRLSIQGIGIKNPQFRWPKRTIPFSLAPGLPKPDRVMDAVAHWNAKTIIRFVPRTTESNFVLVSQDPRQEGSASAVGMQGKAQPLVLRDDSDTGTVIHELGHSVGLWHEQTRSDRDQFVQILLETVPSEQEFNFDKHVADGIDLGPYDFGSIMHYPPNAMSLTNDTTILPKAPLPPGVVMGQRNGLSVGDIKAVELLYQDVAAPHP